MCINFLYACSFGFHLGSLLEREVELKTKEIEKKSSKRAESKELVSGMLLSEELNLEINEDQTDDFDLIPEKMPALSTMKNNLKVLNKRLASTVRIGTDYVQQFDKLKIWIDLKKHGKDIEFEFDLENSNLFESDTPERPETYMQWADRTDFDIEELNEKLRDKELNGEEDEDLEEAEAEFWKDYNKRKKKQVYPNCKINYDCRPIGLLNVYIKNDILSIYLTGKFTWNDGKIDYITIYNIKEHIAEVCRLAKFKFNIDKFIQLAGVFLCDVCIDLQLGDVSKYINAIGSLFPLSTNNYRIMKFGSHGLKLKSKAKNAGSSLTFYDKLAEILNSVSKSKRLAILLDDIVKNSEKLKGLLRVEVQMYSLQDIRVLLEIPMTEHKIVKLTDVLNSKAKLILTRFEKFGATEENLKELIEGYVKNNEKSKTAKWTAKQLQKILAAERYAELIKGNGYNIRRTKSHIITEYELYDESLIQNFTKEIKDNYWNFLMYRKPKAIKLVIELLNKVYCYYGRNGEGANV